MRRLFLHCVDSRVEENATWYSRLHLGPFPAGLATTLGTSLRRTRLQGLPSLRIRAVEIEGAVHEYSRVAGIHEPILDLLLRFREVALSASPSKRSHTRGYFEARGPGRLHAGDLRLPSGVRCINPNFLLGHLAPGAVLRGRILLSSNLQDPLPNSPLEEDLAEAGFSLPPGGPWLPVGDKQGPVRRAGFRIEEAGPFDQSGEILVFEITTDGSVSPRQALRQAAEQLVSLFSGIVGLTLKPSTSLLKRATPSPLSLFSKEKKESPSELEKPRFTTQSSKQSLIQQILGGYQKYAQPLGLDVGNLDLSFSTYQILRAQGISTLGDLLRSLSPSSKPRFGARGPLFQTKVWRATEGVPNESLEKEQPRQLSESIRSEAATALLRFGRIPPSQVLFFFLSMATPLARAVGRRKTAVAQIILSAGSGSVRINGLGADQYLGGSAAHLLKIQAPFRALDTNAFDVEVRVCGGGLNGQVDAIQLGLARALRVVDGRYRETLRAQHLLTRDAREKERRKYGLKKARKAPQFSKRLFFSFSLFFLLRKPKRKKKGKICLISSLLLSFLFFNYVRSY